MQKTVKLQQLKKDEKYLSATTLFLRKCPLIGIRLCLVYFPIILGGMYFNRAEM